MPQEGLSQPAESDSAGHPDLTEPNGTHRGERMLELLGMLQVRHRWSGRELAGRLEDRPIVEQSGADELRLDVVLIPGALTDEQVDTLRFYRPVDSGDPMSQVQRSQVINAPIAPTWAAVSRLGAVQDWHPNVARAEVLSASDTGIGASRRVEFQDGRSPVETVIEESEQQFTTMEMSAEPPLSRAVVTIRTKERSSDTTEVTFSIDYGLKYGPVGPDHRSLSVS